MLRVQVPSVTPKPEVVYVTAKRTTFRRWTDSTLVHILRFPPGYRSTGVFPGQEWKSDKPAWDGDPLSPEEALFVWESYGRDGYRNCKDPQKFVELMSRKDTMNLTISMWKEGISDFVTGGAWDRCHAINFLLELMGEHPVEWLDKIGVVDLMGLRNWVDDKNYRYFGLYDASGRGLSDELHVEGGG
jgi:hypothetical protein